MTEASPLVRRDDEGGVVTLTLTSAPTRNALGLLMLDTLIVAFADIDKDPAARVVLLTGDGPALSSGHDLKEIQAHRNDADHGEAYYERLMQRCSELMQAIVQLSKPVIAVIEGVASAAGCQLVAACDLAIASQSARFALPGVNIGLFCSTPLVAVGRMISRKHAMEMALTGEWVSAERAERIGLVNRVTPDGEAFAEAMKLARAISARSAATIAFGKPAFYRQIEAPLAEAYRITGRSMVENLAHPDSAEGISAFIEKRSARWEGA